MQSCYKIFAVLITVLSQKNIPGYAQMSNFFYKLHPVKGVSTLLLLMVFTLGITPKKTLHDLFANHKDSTSSIPGGNTSQYTKAGINCNCENLVAESQFVAFSNGVPLNLPSVHYIFVDCLPSLVNHSLFHNNLRGPPLRF